MGVLRGAVKVGAPVIFPARDSALQKECLIHTFTVNDSLGSKGSGVQLITNRQNNCNSCIQIGKGCSSCCTVEAQGCSNTVQSNCSGTGVQPFLRLRGAEMVEEAQEVRTA